MQWSCYLKRSQDGIATITIIFLVLILAIFTQGILHITWQQAKSQQEYIRQRQITALGTDLMLKTLEQEDKAKLSTKILPTVLLYPGAERVTARIDIENSTTVPLQAINVIVKGKDYAWQMEHLCLEPPGGKNHSLYNNLIYSEKEIKGELPMDLLPDNYPLPGIMPTIDIKGYLRYKSMPLPEAAALRNVGLLSRIYANDSGVSSGAYVIDKNTFIHGSGVLYSGNPLEIRSGCTSSGKLWLICNDKIVIGDNVNLEQVFLFAQGPIYIGQNVSICGIIISTGKIEIGEGFAMRGDKSVLEEFSTSCYMK